MNKVQIDREQDAKNRAGDVDSVTDVSAPSMGLEGDVAAQIEVRNNNEKKI